MIPAAIILLALAAVCALVLRSADRQWRADDAERMALEALARVARRWDGEA